MDYPKWKYGQDDAAVIVQDESEESALEGAWFDSPADVPEAVIALTDDEQMIVDAKAEKITLLAKADALGISIDARWGIAKIKDALTAAGA